MKFLQAFPILFLVIFASCNGSGPENSEENTDQQEQIVDDTNREDLTSADTNTTEPMAAKTGETTEPPATKSDEKKTSQKQTTTTPEKPATKTPDPREEVKKEEPSKPVPKPVEHVQEKEVSAEYSFKLGSGELRVTGTSTLHDWEMKASSFSADAQMVFGADNQLNEIKSFNLTMPAKNLKSDEKKMNELAWEALKADQHPNITFKLSNATVTPQGSNTYAVKGTGNLTIAGTTKQVILNTTAKVSGSSITFTGKESTTMTTFNVKPPSLMMGTIKTHDNIVLHFNATMNR